MRLTPLLLGASRFLARQAIQQTVRRALPSIYSKLDDQLPGALAAGFGPNGVEDMITSAIIARTGLRPTAADVSGVAALYDPIAAAIPLARRLLR